MIREFPKTRGTLFGVLIIRILLFRVLYWGPLFSETPIQRNICGGIIFSFGNWTSGSADHPKPLNPKPLTLSSAFIGSEELCLTTTHADSSCARARHSGCQAFSAPTRTLTAVPITWKTKISLSYQTYLVTSNLFGESLYINADIVNPPDDHTLLPEALNPIECSNLNLLGLGF